MKKRTELQEKFEKWLADTYPEVTAYRTTRGNKYTNGFIQVRFVGFVAGFQAALGSDC